MKITFFIFIFIVIYRFLPLKLVVLGFGLFLLLTIILLTATLTNATPTTGTITAINIIAVEDNRVSLLIMSGVVGLRQRAVLYSVVLKSRNAMYYNCKSQSLYGFADT